ncbi:MAG TPA: glycosyltransferase [Terracidiphilus sp.]|jgi:glycosyltransferase involved in cell wall biosynthesis
MRIAYMLTSLGIGGAERQVVGLAERMAARGHEVVLIVLRSRQEHEFSAGVEVVRLDMTKSAAGVLGGVLRGQGVLRGFRPDIVHSHTFPANMTARLLRLMGAAPKVISTFHNIYEGGLGRTAVYSITDALSVHSTAVSQAVADRYVKIGAVPGRKCSVITNGIDVEVFAPARGGDSRGRESTREQGAFVWLAAGRAVPAKDFENLLEAFRLVRYEMPDAQLRIAGESEVRPTERRLAEADGLRWLGLRNDMASTITAADGFVLSSAWEGMPLVVGEAMAMEKPVVATDVGGVRELVGDVGVVVPAKDPRTLAKGMLRVMRMPERERREMGKAGRARIVQHFDMDAKANEWEALYAEILGADAHSAEQARMVGL